MAAARRTKKPRRSYHHGDLLAALLTAARVELAHGGHRALSLRRVAARAGVSHAAVYHHFTDKQALLRRLAQDAYAAMDVWMAAGMDSAGDDPRAQLRGAGVGYVRAALHDPAAFALLADTPVGDDAALAAAVAQPFARLTDAVAALHRAGALDASAAAVKRDALLVWSSMHGLALLAHAGHLDALEMSAEHAARVLTQRLAELPLQQ